MSQVQGTSQQKMYSLSKAGYRAHCSTQAQSHCDGVDRTCLTNEEHCWSLWAVWLNLRYTMLMFLNLILYPHTIPTCYTHILHSHPSLHILLYCGEGKESE